MKKEKIVSSAVPSIGKKVKAIAFILAGILLFLILTDLIVSVVSIYRWTHPEKETWTQSPAEFGLDYHTFELDTPNGTVYGWKIAAQTPNRSDSEEWIHTTEYSDKTVVFAPNYDSNREISDLGGVDYFVDLCSAGYNVITFDWTGSGFSEGTKNVFTLDKTEELKAVVAFAEEETGASFLAVQGIGFGCYPAAVAASECDAVDALILDSCYADFSDMFYGSFDFWTSWNIAPVRETVRFLFPLFSGVDLENLSLADPINRLNGKHVLFIQGESDELFGTDGAKYLQSLANTDNTTSLWLVSGSLHLRTRSYDAELYESKVTGFLSETYKTETSA